MDPTTTTPDVFRAELLSRLGLPADASAADVAAAHQALVTLLDRAPADQQEWAQAQLTEAEAVISLLAEVDADAAAAAPAPRAASGTSRRRRTVALILAGLVVGVGAAFGWHVMNSSAVPGIDGAPDPASASQAQGQTQGLDQAKVGELMKRISADPKDVAAYQELAAQYFLAGDYATSATFSEKALAVKPKDDVSLVALGAAQFNLGKNAAAVTSWEKAVAINPKNIEAHYDLGFAYLSGDKPDMAKVKAEWQKVVDIAPDSDIAKNVKTHLSSIAAKGTDTAGK